METVRFGYRAYPHRREARLARRVLGCCRVAFNDAIGECRDAYVRGEKHPSLGELQRRVIVEGRQRPDRVWIAAASAVALQQAVADAHVAYRNFFRSCSGERKGRRLGAPRFKSRRDRRQAARFTRNARFKLREGRRDGMAEVYLPLIGWVPFVLSRPLPSDPSSVTLIHEADGIWRLSFVVERPEWSHQPTGSVAAIDVGLSAFATVLTVGTGGQERVEKIETPRFLRRRQRALTRSQRAWARKRKDGRNRDRQRQKVARLHRRVKDARLDHAHQLAARLSREHDLVITEDYAASGNARNRRMARSASDQALGQFLRVLREKRCQHQTVDRFFPSTQLCSECKTQTGPRGLEQLGVRCWICAHCGASHDRDINAARNLLREGLRLYRLDADGRSESLNASREHAGNHLPVIGELAAKTTPRVARRANPTGDRAGSTVGEPHALTRAA